MKYTRLLKASENPNNPMSNSFRYEEDDWMYMQERIKREKNKNPLHNPVDNPGDVDPSSQPFAMNPGNQVQFMADAFATADINDEPVLEDAGPVPLEYLMFLSKEPDPDMNPIGDLDCITFYEMSTCVDGNTAERRYPEEEPLYTEDPLFYEDPFGIQVEDTYQRKRNPYDKLNPMTPMASEDSLDHENKKKTKKDPKNIVFPPYTYPMEGIDSGIPYAEQVPVYTYPMQI